MKYLINKKRGFTLVETMVAIAVFSLVMVTAMSALLNVIDANNKARAIKNAVNNINFALESISRNARMAIDYGCGDDAPPTGNCPAGGNIIRYRTSRADQSLDEEDSDGKKKNKFVYYKFDSGRILECLEKEGLTCDYNTGPYVPITSNEVKITNATFYVVGTDDPRSKQPRIIMTISGEAGSKEKTKTKFDLQTSISQRIRITPPTSTTP